MDYDLIFVTLAIFLLLLVSGCTSTESEVVNVSEEIAKCKELQCWIDLAVSEKDPSICASIVLDQNLTESKDYCYYFSVSEANIIDSSFCEEIQGEWKRFCYSAINHNFSDLAIEQNNVELCEKSTGKEVKDSCYSRFAFEFKDQTACNKIEDKIKQESCFFESNTELDFDDCEKIDNQANKSRCYSGAIDLKLKKGDFVDSSICENISFGMSRDICYHDIAVETNNLDLCEKSYSSSLCHSSIAINTNNPALCDKSNTGYLPFDECLRRISNNE